MNKVAFILGYMDKVATGRYLGDTLRYIREQEDDSPRVYDDRGHRTIGMGYQLNPQSVERARRLLPHLADKDFEQWELSPIESRTLTYGHINEVVLPEIRKAIPRFDEFPPDTKKYMISEWYRGMLGQSPKTIGHINAGDWRAASTEYLDAEDYRNSSGGVRGRMEALSNNMYAQADPEEARRIAENTYVVQPRDTLGAISRSIGIPLSELVRLNNIENPNRISVGQRLRIR